MNGLVRDIISIPSGTSLSGSARLTNFNPDRFIFIVSGSSAITKDDLKKIKVTANFKNSVGSGLAICNNLPLDLIANYSDYHYGFGLLGSDLKSAFALDLGKYILKADDEITISISTSSALSQSLSLYVIAMDSYVGKEKLLTYKYIDASATQAYQESGVCSVYAQISEPSANVFMTVDDFYGSNNISELAVAGIGASLGSAEDFDNFGIVFNDSTGLTQPVTVRAGSDREEFLIVVWNFDVNRIGFANADLSNVQLLAQSIKASNPTKARCLEYFYD